MPEKWPSWPPQDAASYPKLNNNVPIPQEKLGTATNEIILPASLIENIDDETIKPEFTKKVEELKAFSLKVPENIRVNVIGKINEEYNQINDLLSKWDITPNACLERIKKFINTLKATVVEAKWTVVEANVQSVEANREKLNKDLKSFYDLFWKDENEFRENFRKATWEDFTLQTEKAKQDLLQTKPEFKDLSPQDQEAQARLQVIISNETNLRKAVDPSKKKEFDTAFVQLNQSAKAFWIESFHPDNKSVFDDIRRNQPSNNQDAFKEAFAGEIARWATFTKRWDIVSVQVNWNYEKTMDFSHNPPLLLMQLNGMDMEESVKHEPLNPRTLELRRLEENVSRLWKEISEEWPEISKTREKLVNERERLSKKYKIIISPGFVGTLPDPAWAFWPNDTHIVWNMWSEGEKNLIMEEVNMIIKPLEEKVNIFDKKEAKYTEAQRELVLFKQNNKPHFDRYQNTDSLAMQTLWFANSLGFSELRSDFKNVAGKLWVSIEDLNSEKWINKFITAVIDFCKKRHNINPNQNKWDFINPFVISSDNVSGYKINDQFLTKNKIEWKNPTEIVKILFGDFMKNWIFNFEAFSQEVDKMNHN